MTPQPAAKKSFTFFVPERDIMKDIQRFLTPQQPSKAFDFDTKGLKLVLPVREVSAAENETLYEPDSPWERYHAESHHCCGHDHTATECSRQDSEHDVSKISVPEEVTSEKILSTVTKHSKCLRNPEIPETRKLKLKI